MTTADAQDSQREIARLRTELHEALAGREREYARAEDAEDRVKGADALLAELRDVEACLDIAVRERDDYYGELSLLRAAVLAIAAEMTHEDRHVRHGAWAVRLREAAEK